VVPFSTLFERVIGRITGRSIGSNRVRPRIRSWQINCLDRNDRDFEALRILEVERSAMRYRVFGDYIGLPDCSSWKTYAIYLKTTDSAAETGVADSADRVEGSGGIPLRCVRRTGRSSYR
jgi:hypothetical protein